MPADRMVGCPFAEQWDSAAAVALNGGTLFGTPTISDGLITLNGTTDYVKLNLCGHEFYSDEITIELEFWPDFATDEDVIRTLYFSTPGAKYCCYKHNNVNGNQIFIYLGDIHVASIFEAVYSPFWEINQRNVIQISSNGTTTNVRLNNNLVFSGGNAWTKKTPTEFTIGAHTAGVNKFKGKIGPVKIYQSVLTERDHYNTYYNKAYGFTNDAVAYWGMRNQDHDAANNRTLDVSGYNNHAVWTPGTTQPTKGTRRGYYFDSGDYMIVPATGMFNRQEVGILLEFTPGFTTDHNGSHFFFDSTTGYRYFIGKRANAAANVLRIYLGNTQIATIAEAVYSPYWRQGERNLLAISSNGSFTDAHLNEGLILDADNTAWTACDPNHLVIGANQGTSNRFLGDIHSMMIFPYLLTPRMVADLRHNRRNSIGEV